jgi:hypothetical protein
MFRTSYIATAIISAFGLVSLAHAQTVVTTGGQQVQQQVSNTANGGGGGNANATGGSNNGTVSGTLQQNGSQVGNGTGTATANNQVHSDNTSSANNNFNATLTSGATGAQANGAATGAQANGAATGAQVLGSNTAVNQGAHVGSATATLGQQNQLQGGNAVTTARAGDTVTNGGTVGDTRGGVVGPQTATTTGGHVGDTTAAAGSAAIVGDTRGGTVGATNGGNAGGATSTAGAASSNAGGASSVANGPNGTSQSSSSGGSVGSISIGGATYQAPKMPVNGAVVQLAPQIQSSGVLQTITTSCGARVDIQKIRDVQATTNVLFGLWTSTRNNGSESTTRANGGLQLTPTEWEVVGEEIDEKGRKVLVRQRQMVGYQYVVTTAVLGSSASSGVTLNGTSGAGALSGAGGVQSMTDNIKEFACGYTQTQYLVKVEPPKVTEAEPSAILIVREAEQEVASKPRITARRADGKPLCDGKTIICDKQVALAGKREERGRVVDCSKAAPADARLCSDAKAKVGTSFQKKFRLEANGTLVPLQ